MNYENLLYGILCGLGSYIFYLVHKSWYKTVTRKQTFDKYTMKGETIVHWTIIIGLGIGAFLNLLSALMDWIE